MQTTLQQHTLQVLMIEDSQDDADLTLLQLEEQDLKIISTRVETENELRRALQNSSWDIVISDFNLPRFSALKAMSVLREADQDIPFIVVSGCIGEESVVELMKEGASDFVMKDKLSRLALVVDRELQDAAIRRSHRRALEALSANEMLLREITNTLGEGVFVVNNQGKLDFMNPEAERLLGWTSAELLGKNIFKIINSRQPESIILSMSDSRLSEIWGPGGGYRADDEFFLRKDGSLMPVSFVMTPIINNGKAVASVTAFQDISERKKAEQELLDSRKQLRELSAHLQSVREEERTHIARELHDELGQMLTGVKLRATWLIGQLPKDQPVIKSKADDLSKLIDETMDAMRRTASDLRPVMLDDLGLAAAVEWLTEDFAERTGLVVKLDLSKGKCNNACISECSLQWEDNLNAEMATAAFRIVQESLTNIARHAEAENVIVRLCCRDGDMVVQISDDGKGISKENEKKRDSYGVIGMRERAFGLGGTLNLSGNIGKGTTVEAIFPVKPIILDRTLQ